MSVPISKLHKFKLETTFGDGYVVNVTDDWTLSTVHRRRLTWKQEKMLGKGGFGDVWLQKEAETGKLRAVKKLRKETAMVMGFTQELLALIGLGDASTPVPLGNRTSVAGWSPFRVLKITSIRFVE